MYVPCLRAECWPAAIPYEAPSLRLADLIYPPTSARRCAATLCSPINAAAALLRSCTMQVCCIGWLLPMLLLRCCAAALLRCSAAALCTQPQSRQLSTAPRRCLHAGLLIRTRRLTSSLPSPVRRQTDTVPLACGQARSLSCGTCQLPARSLSLQLRAVCPTGALQPPRRQPARAFCCPGCLKPSSVCKSVSSSASVPFPH